MKVVLINTPVEQGRYKSKQTSIPPIGLGYLASYLESNGIQCNIIDGKLEGISPKKICEQVLMQKPDIVGLSAMTPDIIAASKIADMIKRILPETDIVLGGAHSIAIPKETLEEYPSIDFVVTGEGEETFVELIDHLSGDKAFHEIKGLGFRNGDEIIINPHRDYIRDLDRLPFPAWDKFNNKSGTYFLLSARGCPYRCFFCMRALGRIVRPRSPENVVDEIGWLVKKFNARKIIFQDETFTVNKKRVLQMTELIMQKDLHKKIKWIAQTRVDRGDAEVFAMMKKAGCEEVEFGVESGNQDILNRVCKDIKLSQVEETIGLAKKAGFRIGCTFILGHPYETEETIKETINFAVKLNPDLLSFGIMSPYPGTKIWDMAQKGEGNYRILSNNWEEFVRFGGGCLELTNLPRRRLELLQIKAYLHFYLRTFKIIGFLQYGLPRWRQTKAVLKKLLSSR